MLAFKDIKTVDDILIWRPDEILEIDVIKTNRKEIEDVNEFLQDIFYTPTGRKYIDKINDEYDNPKAFYTKLILDFRDYQYIPSFPANGNVYEANVGVGINEDVHMIMRALVEHHLQEAFKAMKVDMNDVNIRSDKETGNIGTPGRIAKMWCGANPDDTTELLSGRWNRQPRMAAFETNSTNEAPIWVKTQIRGVCSHHVIGFHNFPNSESSYAVIGYIPKNGIKGGISKVNRLVNFLSRRMWLQEDLTDKIGKTIEEAFQTDSVYVALININHGCSWTRGANDTDATTTTTYASGKFLEDPDLVPEKYKG